MISKRHNCLNADIVEALQCLKALIKQDLMVREVVSLIDEEQDLDFTDEQLANQVSTPSEVVEGSANLIWGAPVPDDSGNDIIKDNGHNTEIELD